MAILLDIAQGVGMARSMVSGVLRKDLSLSTPDETGEKILTAARALEYEMKQGKILNHTIANIVMTHKDAHFISQIDSVYYFSARTGIKEVCYKRRYKFIFTPLQFIDSVEEKPDGVLMVGNSEKVQVDLILKKIRTSNIVFTSKVNYYPDKMDWITYDIKDCVYENMDYLREYEHRRIVYTGDYDSEDMSPDSSRFAHFEQYMKSHPELGFMGSTVEEHGVENGCQMMSRWLAKDRELPDAFFTSNDLITIDAIKALNERSIGVPDVVAVAAINGDSSGTLSFPTLAIVDIHTYEMEKEAVTASEEWIHHKRTLAKKMEFQAGLVKRGSAKKTD